MKKLIGKITGILIVPFLACLFYFGLEKFIYSIFVVKEPTGVNFICFMSTVLVSCLIGAISITHFEKEGE